MDDRILNEIKYGKRLIDFGNEPVKPIREEIEKVEEKNEIISLQEFVKNQSTL
jgi:hypothetical protein